MSSNIKSDFPRKNFAIGNVYPQSNDQLEFLRLLQEKLPNSLPPEFFPLEWYDFISQRLIKQLFSVLI